MSDMRRIVRTNRLLAELGHTDPISALEELARLRAEVEALRRGEFICRRCGLRKDSECPRTHDF